MPNKTGWPRRFSAPPTGPLHVFIAGNVTPPSVVPLILVDAGTYSPVQNTVVHPEIAEGLSPTQGCSSRYGDVLTLSMFGLFLEFVNHDWQALCELMKVPVGRKHGEIMSYGDSAD